MCFKAFLLHCIVVCASLCKISQAALSLSPRPLPKKQVIVTGAAGKTGKLVFSLLIKDERYYPLGLVRTERSGKQLIKEVENCGLENIWVCDVTTLDPQGQNGIPNGVDDAAAMIICTSAKPLVRKRSVLKAFLQMPLNAMRGKKAFDFRSLEFYYKKGQHPELVDYQGQIAQIDLAKKLGIPHVILVSSMGGTDSKDFLNTLGKNKKGEGNGDILIWKRKAEKYLIDSGLQYTIIHPGGLKDTPSGDLGIDLDVDDKLKSRTIRSISRCDVAKLCIAALSVTKGKSTAFDCVNAELSKGVKRKSAEDTIQDFLASGKTYDYSDMNISENFSI